MVQDGASARRYDSFVLRCWRVGGGERRIEVEHLQSGARTRVVTLRAAVAWITSECGEEVVSGEHLAQDNAPDRSTD